MTSPNENRSVQALIDDLGNIAHETRLRAVDDLRVARSGQRWLLGEPLDVAPSQRWRRS